MNHISELHDYNHEKYDDKAKECLRPEIKKGIKDELEQMIDAELEWLEEHAGEYISDVAARRAERFIERVLNGDEDAAKELLGNAHSDRYKSCGYDGGKPWAHVIRGSVFETGGIRLRRKIVEAHADLIKDERIKDLESIVDGLRQQIVMLEQEVNGLRDRYR